MKYKNILIITILFFSCSKEVIQDIEVIVLQTQIEKLQHLSIENYNIDFEIIPLEFNENSLISRPHRIIEFDNKFYILSFREKNLLIFDVNGKFIKKLATGRGPGELLSPLDFTIDKSKNTLEVLDFYNVVMIYNLEGEFVSSLEFETYHNEFEKVNDTYILYNANIDQKNLYNFTYYKNGKKEHFLKRTGVTETAYGFNKHLNKYMDTLYCQASYDSYLYKFNVNNCEFVPYLKFENVYVDKNAQLENIDALEEINKNNYDFVYDFHFFDNKRIYCFTGHIKNYSIDLIYLPTTKELFIHPLQTFPYMIALGYDKDYLYYCFSPSEFEYIEKSKLTQHGMILYDKLNNLISDKDVNYENMYIIKARFNRNQ